MTFNGKKCRLDRYTLSNGGLGLRIVTKKKGKVLATICNDFPRVPDGTGLVPYDHQIRRFIEDNNLGERTYSVLEEPYASQYEFDMATINRLTGRSNH